MTKFKVGDKVRCIREPLVPDSLFVGGIGRVYVVEEALCRALTLNGVAGNQSSRFELVEEKEMQYEDKWHLNDGSVEIPDNAEKLYNPEGTSIVAYRLVKEPVVREYVRYIENSSVFGPSQFTYREPFVTHSITYVEVDGELTESRLEKL